jgi:hypothetical protein
MDPISPIDAFHNDLADGQRLARLYAPHSQVGQVLVEGFVVATRAIDRMNAEADRIETERRTKLYYEQQKKQEEALAVEKKRDDDNAPGATGVKVDPIKPITPAAHSVADDHIQRTQHLEKPLVSLGIEMKTYEPRTYEFKKDKVYEVKSKVYEIPDRTIKFPDRGIKLE